VHAKKAREGEDAALNEGRGEEGRGGEQQGEAGA